MTDEMSNTEMDKALFVSLVMMFSSTAMQQLGKLVNPVTQKAEVDLRGAQASIDILTMLAGKTKGNLDKEEEQLLREAISSLQMNYVETAESAPRQDAAQKEKGARSESGGSDPVAGTEKTTGAGASEASGRSPKFHKSYGEK